DHGSLANEQHAQPPQPQRAGLRKEKLIGFPETKRIGRDFQEWPSHSHRDEKGVDCADKGKHGQSQSDKDERTYDGGCKPERPGPTLLEISLCRARDDQSHDAVPGEDDGPATHEAEDGFAFARETNREPNATLQPYCWRASPCAPLPLAKKPAGTANEKRE